MPGRWVMGNLARRDQYALPITGGLEQQALARMPAISPNIEDRRQFTPTPTQPPPFNMTDAAAALREKALGMPGVYAGEPLPPPVGPDQYGFSKGLDQQIASGARHQSGPPVPGLPSHVSPETQFAEYLPYVDPLMHGRDDDASRFLQDMREYEDERKGTVDDPFTPVPGQRPY